MCGIGIIFKLIYITQENKSRFRIFTKKAYYVAESNDKKISEKTKFDLMKTQSNQLTRLVEKLDLIIEKSPF